MCVGTFFFRSSKFFTITNIVNNIKLKFEFKNCKKKKLFFLKTLKLLACKIIMIKFVHFPLF